MIITSYDNININPVTQDSSEINKKSTYHEIYKAVNTSLEECKKYNESINRLKELAEVTDSFSNTSYGRRTEVLMATGQISGDDELYPGNVTQRIRKQSSEIAPELQKLQKSALEFADKVINVTFKECPNDPIIKIMKQFESGIQSANFNVEQIYNSFVDTSHEVGALIGALPEHYYSSEHNDNRSRSINTKVEEMKEFMENLIKNS